MNYDERHWAQVATIGDGDTLVCKLPNKMRQNITRGCCNLTFATLRIEGLLDYRASLCPLQLSLVPTNIEIGKQW